MTSNQPGEQPAYTAPQDPWSNGPGVASPPTDPIPQPLARAQFAQGVATPVAPPPSVWSQETIAHNDPYGPPTQGGSRAGLWVLVVVLVLVLGAGGGIGAWYVISQRIQSQATPTQSQTRFDPRAVRVGDCLIQDETMLKIVACTNTKDVLQVRRITIGLSLQRNQDGDLDGNSANVACIGLEAWDNSFAAWDSDDDAQDAIFCTKDLSPDLAP